MFVIQPLRKQWNTHIHMYSANIFTYTQRDMHTYTGARKAAQNTLPLDIKLTIIWLLSEIWLQSGMSVYTYNSNT